MSMFTDDFKPTIIDLLSVSQLCIILSGNWSHTSLIVLYVGNLVIDILKGLLNISQEISIINLIYFYIFRH